MKLSQLLGETVRSFASHSCYFYERCRELPFAYAERQVHSVLFPAILDVVYRDEGYAFLEQPVARAPGGPGAEEPTGWADYWIVHRKHVVLAEVKHGWNALRTDEPTQRIVGKWETCLKQLNTLVAKEGAPRMLAPGEHAHVLGLLIAIHFYGGQDVPARPSKEEAWDAHRRLIRRLPVRMATTEWPIRWHGVWRVPPRLEVDWAGDDQPRLHCPAVSFVAAAEPVRAEC